MIGLGPLEARQKAVVDVDTTPGEIGRHLVGQNLHVARQHDEIDLLGLHQCADPELLISLRLLCNRQMVEGDRSEIGRTENLARVVRYNPRDIHLQLADTTTIEEADEAMVTLRNEHQNTLPLEI